jgi:hypothetical protein
MDIPWWTCDGPAGRTSRPTALPTIESGVECLGFSKSVVGVLIALPDGAAGDVGDRVRAQRGTGTRPVAKGGPHLTLLEAFRLVSVQP